MVGVAVGAPALGGVVARPLGGRLADRFGPARLVCAGAAAMSGAVLPLLVLPVTVTWLVASRLVVGMGEGVLMSAATLWLLRICGPARRGRSLGHVGLANYAGLALGPLLAAALGGAARPGPVLVAATVLPWLGVALCLPVRASGHATGGRAAASKTPRAAAKARLNPVLGPGVGLALVNVGYVALLSFGAAAAASHGVDRTSMVVPAFAATVIVVRTVLGGAPDRFGAERVLAVSACAEAGGLLLVAGAPTSSLVVMGTVALAAGQALAVPALGLLALRSVPADGQGAAAGAFFAFFDVGVGAGGPLVGVVAHLGGPVSALCAAAVGVGAVAVRASTTVLNRRAVRTGA
jgi:MFS family permease